MRVPDTLWGREEIICVVINAIAADVMFSQVLSIVEKGMETLRYNENCSGKWLT